MLLDIYDNTTDLDLGMEPLQWPHYYLLHNQSLDRMLINHSKVLLFHPFRPSCFLFHISIKPGYNNFITPNKIRPYSHLPCRSPKKQNKTKQYKTRLLNAPSHSLVWVVALHQTIGAPEDVVFVNAHRK